MKNIINAKRKKRRKQKQKQYQITKTKRRRNKKTRKGKRLFPNRSDLAYAGRNTVNQEVYHAAKLTKKASTELNLIIKQRIDQFISRGGREVERILPKLYVVQSKIYIKQLLDYSKILEKNNVLK